MVAWIEIFFFLINPHGFIEGKKRNDVINEFVRNENIILLWLLDFRTRVTSKSGISGEKLRYSPLLLMVQAGADAMKTHMTHLVDELIG